MDFSPALELVGAFLVLWAGRLDQLLSQVPELLHLPKSCPTKGHWEPEEPVRGRVKYWSTVDWTFKTMAV